MPSHFSSQSGNPGICSRFLVSVENLIENINVSQMISNPHKNCDSTKKMLSTLPKKCFIRKHSSRMRTVHCTDQCVWGVYLPGGCTCPGGVPAQGGVPARGCTCPWGVPAHGGVPAQGVPVERVCIPACTEADTPSACEQND